MYYYMMVKTALSPSETFCVVYLTILKEENACKWYYNLFS